MELLESELPGQQDLLMRPLPSSGPVEKIDTRTNQIVRTALIVGGTLAAAWVIFMLLQQNSMRKDQSEAIGPVNPEDHSTKQSSTAVGHDVLATIGDRVAKEATIFLLNLAREKIAAWLASKRIVDDQRP